MSAGLSLHRCCPVCADNQATPCLSKATLRLVRCRRCAMVYADPVPSEFVSGAYYDAVGDTYYLSAAKLESDYSPVRFERELRLFRRYCPRGRVLDVGCSSGAFLFQLRSRAPGAYDILGTDVSGPALDYAEARGIPVRRGDFLQMDFAGAPFDAITFWAVLEHLAQPRLFLEKAATLLKPEGLCLVLVPNFQSLAVRLLGSKYRYIYDQHLNYFTRSTLRQLAQPRFRLLAAHSTHFNPVVIWQDWRSGGRPVSNPQRAELLRRTTAWKQNPLLAPARFLYRWVESVLGVAFLADNLLFVLQPLSQSQMAAEPSVPGPEARLKKGD